MGSIENGNAIAGLNLKDFSGRKGSQQLTLASDSARIRAQMPSESHRGDHPAPFKLDTSEFQTQYKFSDGLQEEDFSMLRIMIAKRKE